MGQAATDLICRPQFSNCKASFSLSWVFDSCPSGLPAIIVVCPVMLLLLLLFLLLQFLLFLLTLAVSFDPRYKRCTVVPV
jgi:hypothetical protein